MYLDHFKLKDLPFRLSPDPAFLFMSRIHSRAKAYMESNIWFTDGFVVIRARSARAHLADPALSHVARRSPG